MNEGYYSQLGILWTIFSRHPDAAAYVRGSAEYPDIKGVVHFFQHPQGVLVLTEMMELPTNRGECGGKIFALHIHEGETCTGNSEDSFADTKMHYNPGNCLHPFHAGDLPPLFESDGYALSAFFTKRFQLKDVLGKTVIVHEGVDDFSTQPSGNAGAKIACGKIVPIVLD